MDFRMLNSAFGLYGKIALITGGATGLGFATAKCMLAAGAKVVVVGKSVEKLEKAKAEVPDLDIRQADITETDNLPVLISEIVKEYGHIDILVNNAGVHCKKPVCDITTADIDSVMNVHVKASLALSQAVIPYMKKNGYGSIIFISSMSALFGLSEVAAYGAAKSAVLAFTKIIADEVSEFGIRVNALIPGFIDSPMFRKATDSDPIRRNKILGRTPMKRFGEAEDIGWGAVYLSSEAARFITGTQLVIDGGCSIGF